MHVFWDLWIQWSNCPFFVAKKDLHWNCLVEKGKSGYFCQDAKFCSTPNDKDTIVSAAHFLRVKWSTFLGCRSATAVILNYGLNFWLAQDWQKCKHWFQWQSIASLLVLCHCANANATPLPLEIWISLWITWIPFILWFFMTSKICLIIVHGFMNAAIKNYGYDQWSLTINVHSYIYEHRSCMINDHRYRYEHQSHMINDHRYIAMNIDRQWSLIMSIITHDQWSLPWNAIDHTWSVLINGLYRDP